MTQYHSADEVKGTQAAWDGTYKPEINVYGRTSGLHMFNAGDTIVRVDGREGYVLRRSALTADVRWRDNHEEETIDQFDERYISCSKR